jgi:NhaA family Na+:H+ antiporter
MLQSFVFWIKYLHQEKILAGVVLLVTTLLTLAVVNMGYYREYDVLVHTKLSLAAGDYSVTMSLLHVVNDVLMVVFFFHVGIELRYELTYGTLRRRSDILLPLIGAFFGMLIPSLIYLYLNISEPVSLRGWAIPSATDIAFAIGFLSMFGKRVPVVLHALLLAIAVFDDMGAIAIIALFYTEQVVISMLIFSLLVVAGFFLLRQLQVKPFTPYVILTIFLWFGIHHSGLHATLAGVAAAFFFPSDYPERLHAKPGDRLITIEKSLYRYVYYAIVPFFAFMNTGLYLGGLSMTMITHPTCMGVALGLIVGKPIGIVLGCVSARYAGICKWPSDLHIANILGVAFLCGIGFTMSLFIGDLAFDDEIAWQSQYVLYSKLGVLLGSGVSVLCAMFWLWWKCLLPKSPDALTHDNA